MFFSSGFAKTSSNDDYYRIFSAKGLWLSKGAFLAILDNYWSTAEKKKNIL
jgi:hypothetical protein